MIQYIMQYFKLSKNGGCKMKKLFKFLMMLLLISAAISLGLFVLWLLASGFVVSYLFKAKEKYDNMSDFFKEAKNIIAVILSVVLLIVVPITFKKASDEYDEKLRQQQKQEAILEEQKLKEQEEKKKEDERASILNAKSRFNKDQKNGKDIEDAGMLTEEEIEKHNITEDEIARFNKDREEAIKKYEEKELGKKYESLAKTYARESIISTIKKIRTINSEYSEDMTKFIVRGSYTGKNQYGADVRGGYEVEFDLSTGEMINIIIDKERVQ